MSTVGLDEHTESMEAIERQCDTDFVEIAQGAAPADSLEFIEAAQAEQSEGPDAAEDVVTEAAEPRAAEPRAAEPRAAESQVVESQVVEPQVVDSEYQTKTSEPVVDRAASAVEGAPEEPSAAQATPIAVDLLPVVVKPSFSTFVPQTDETSAFDLQFCNNQQLRAQFRAMRRSVIDAVARTREQGRAPLVVITSSVPGDGKSFISFHLANSLTGEPDLEPVLVDGDLSRQQISRLFESDDHKGMADGLRKREPLHRLIHRTDIANLKLMRAGERSLEAVEFLGGPRWLDLVDNMRSSGPGYLFLIDAPPILATAEAQYLARSADLVLFVVRSESTARSAVTQALARLGSKSNLAFVFNGRVSMQANYYFGYSYYESFDALPKK